MESSENLSSTLCPTQIGFSLSLTSSPCFLIVPLLCYHCHCSVIFLMLHYHPLSVITLSFSPCTVIIPYSVSIPLLCQHPPVLSSLCHFPPALSASPCSVSIPLFCQHPPALSSSPCSVIIPLLCHCIPLSYIPALWHNPHITP